MRTLKLTIAYDGTRYAGWQRQAHRQPPTIQATLERALHHILRERVRVIASGRTDAGVHAEAQVAHTRIRSSITIERLLRGVNHLLPTDIAVTRIDEAGDAFHARFDATRKRYRYRVFTGAVATPFIRPYVHHVRAKLNVPLMRREAAVLAGRHDFRAFVRSGQRPGTTTRTLYDVSLKRRAQGLQMEFEGDGFLHTMVRSMVGTLLDVGRGRLPQGTVKRMLTTQRRELAGTTAPSKGLTLVSVTHENVSSTPMAAGDAARLHTV